MSDLALAVWAKLRVGIFTSCNWLAHPQVSAAPKWTYSCGWWSPRRLLSGLLGGLITRSLLLLLVASIPLQLPELPYCTVWVPKGGKGAASSLEGGAQSGNDIISTVQAQRSPGSAQTHGCGEIGPSLGWRNDQELWTFCHYFCYYMFPVVEKFSAFKLNFQVKFENSIKLDTFYQK